MHHIAALVAMLAKGGPVMVPLLVCSVLSLSVIIERLTFWWTRRDSASVDRALRMAEHAKFDEAAELLGSSRAPPARVVAAGLEHHAARPTKAMELAAQEEQGEMRRYLPLLDTVITLSPLLGLLGTVTGMIAAFGVLSSSGLNPPNAITGGVAESLIATAAGLGIAIATLVPYNYFSSRADRAAEASPRWTSPGPPESRASPSPDPVPIEMIRVERPAEPPKPKIPVKLTAPRLVTRPTELAQPTPLPPTLLSDSRRETAPSIADNSDTSRRFLAGARASPSGGCLRGPPPRALTGRRGDRR